MYSASHAVAEIRMKKVLLIAVGVAVLLAVGIQIIPVLVSSPPPSLSLPLKDLLPAAAPGWQVQDLPLGNTEALDQRSKDILNMDDFVYRDYRRAGQDFSVYVAYWKPGKMPVRLVNSHTPDRCWTWNGLECKDMQFQVKRSWSGGQLKPFEWRIFTRDETPVYVIYWHLVGGKVHLYRVGFNENPPPYVIVKDLWKYGFNLKREQFFVRINSSQSLEKIWNDPGFQKILGDLARLCLDEQAPALAAKGA